MSANVDHTSHPPSAKEAPLRNASARRSISGASIPLSAFVAPHAPSITPSSVFHMRDPRKPARIQDTPWTLSLPEKAVMADGSIGGRWEVNGWTDRGGSPVHAWLFFLGFLLFPVWWIGGFAVPILRTRKLENGDAEKGQVVLDDPQVEHGTPIFLSGRLSAFLSGY